MWGWAETWWRRGRSFEPGGLIFDIGVNHGEDTDFYLRKGFRVVGVEASPIIAAELRQRFAREIGAGRFTLLNVGIWDQRTTLPFYRNLDNDHWSSFQREHGTRNDTRYEVLDIECLTIADLFERFGVPHYLKIDVEGADRHILHGLRTMPALPKYISIEEYGAAAIDDLTAIGFSELQLAPQRTKIPRRPGLVPEGIYVHKHFDGHDSGPFGSELPGEWLKPDAFRAVYERTVRTADGVWIGAEHEWYDIHGRR